MVCNGLIGGFGGQHQILSDTRVLNDISADPAAVGCRPGWERGPPSAGSSSRWYDVMASAALEPIDCSFKTVSKQFQTLRVLFSGLGPTEKAQQNVRISAPKLQTLHIDYMKQKKLRAGPEVQCILPHEFRSRHITYLHIFRIIFRIFSASAHIISHHLTSSHIYIIHHYSVLVRVLEVAVGVGALAGGWKMICRLFACCIAGDLHLVSQRQHNHAPHSSMVLGTPRCVWELHFVLHFVAFQEERKEESQSYFKADLKWFQSWTGPFDIFPSFIVHPLSWSQSMNARQFLVAVWILRRESVCTTTLPRSRRWNENELDKWREFQDVSSAPFGVQLLAKAVLNAANLVLGYVGCSLAWSTPSSMRAFATWAAEISAKKLYIYMIIYIYIKHDKAIKWVAGGGEFWFHGPTLKSQRSLLTQPRIQARNPSQCKDHGVHSHHAPLDLDWMQCSRANANTGISHDQSSLGIAGTWLSKYLPCMSTTKILKSDWRQVKRKRVKCKGTYVKI